MPMRSPYCHPQDRGRGRGDRRRGALPPLNHRHPEVDRQRMNGQPPRCHPPGPPDVPVPALEEPRRPRGGGRTPKIGVAWTWMGHGVAWTCLGVRRRSQRVRGGWRSRLRASRQRSCGAASGCCCSLCSSSGTLAVFNALPEDCAWRVVGSTAGMSSRATERLSHRNA